MGPHKSKHASTSSRNKPRRPILSVCGRFDHKLAMARQHVAQTGDPVYLEVGFDGGELCQMDLRLVDLLIDLFDLPRINSRTTFLAEIVFNAFHHSVITHLADHWLRYPHINLELDEQCTITVDLGKKAQTYFGLQGTLVSPAKYKRLVDRVSRAVARAQKRPAPVDKENYPRGLDRAFALAMLLGATPEQAERMARTGRPLPISGSYGLAV